MRGGERCVATALIGERLREIVPGVAGIGMFMRCLTVRGLGRGKVAQRISGVAQADARFETVRPASQCGRICLACGAGRNPFEVRNCGNIVFLLRSRGNSLRRHRHHCPVVAARPSALEHVERHRQAPRHAGAQHELVGRKVVADHHRVVPQREDTERQILKNDHRRARADFAQHVVEAPRQRIGDKAVAARAPQHLRLQ